MVSIRYGNKKQVIMKTTNLNNIVMVINEYREAIETSMGMITNFGLVEVSPTGILSPRGAYENNLPQYSIIMIDVYKRN